jgi:hypothetical protein
VKTKKIDSIMTIDDIRMENEEGKVVDFNFQLLSIAINIVTQMVFKKRYLNFFVNFLSLFCPCMQKSKTSFD